MASTQTVTYPEAGTIHQRIVEPGNATRYWIIVGETSGVPWVALPDFGKSAVMAWQFYATTGYVANKLGLNEADAGPVAKALNEIAAEVNK